jgi:YidC/Oxa1 family membrane protein insertase
MKMDKNTIIGFVLIGVLLIGMFVVNINSRNAYLAEEKKKAADSLAKLPPKPPVDTAAQKLDQAKRDSALEAQKKLPPTFSADTVEHLTVVKNKNVRITFTNKGGQPKEVELLNFKTFDGKPLLLQTGDFNKLNYPIKVGDNSTRQTSDVAFLASEVKVNADSSQVISFSLKDSSGTRTITHQYTIKPDDYMVDFNIIMTGADKLIDQNSLNLTWQTEARQFEKTLTYERTQSYYDYYYNGKTNFERIGKGGSDHFDKPVDWIAFNPQFFITTLIAKPNNKFQSATVNWVAPEDSLRIVMQSTVNAKLAIDNPNKTIQLQLYYGPNDYKLLNKYDNEMEKITMYGSGPFSFVKYINRHFLLPVWDFIRKYVSSYGIVILLLTLLIRLITSPILYKSYLSGAKMKVLKPEVDALKAKFTDKTGKLDQQAFSMEQMKLWKTAGVSPLGGCLPALLQIPIFMSLYYFFQSNIALRGQSFLWAKDLAAYDSILDFGNIPVISSLYGSHVSLFTLTATLTSLLISIYSMRNMQDNSNPIMKYMPYIFPVILLGVFNNLPAALTWYYTVSNTITLLLQIFIQKYVINHDKIKLQIAENKKKPVKQSKLQERVAAMQEANKKMQEQRNKGGKK